MPHEHFLHLNKYELKRNLLSIPAPALLCFLRAALTGLDPRPPKPSPKRKPSPNRGECLELLYSGHPSSEQNDPSSERPDSQKATKFCPDRALVGIPTLGNQLSAANFFERAILLLNLLPSGPELTGTSSTERPATVVAT